MRAVRCLLLVVLPLCAYGGLPPLSAVNKPAKCVLDSASSVNQMLDAALFMWASIQQCSGGSSAVQCAIDVSSVVRSVNGILKFILRAVDECSTIQTLNHRCAAESFLLGEGVAGIAKASAGIARKCKPLPTAPPPAPAPTDPCAPSLPGFPRKLCAVQQSRRLGAVAIAQHYRAVTCAVDIKDSMQSVAKASVNIMTVKKSCNTDKWACTDNALRIISAFADLSTFLIGAVDHCSRIKFAAGFACAAEIDRLISELSDVARASGRVNKLCRPQPPAPTIPVPTPVPAPTIPVPTPVPAPTVPVPTPVPAPAAAPRLYAQEDGAPLGAPREREAVRLGLVAALPAAVVLSFLGGTWLGRRRWGESQDFDGDLRELE